jgi:hypothetical protein
MLKLMPLCIVQAKVLPIVEVSSTRRYVPITGGTVTGRIQGTIGTGFNDYQIVREDGTLEIQARYVIDTHDGAKLYVENNGIRTAPSEVLEKMRRGEAVDPALVYFRAVPRFETAHPDYLWLTRKIFLSSGQRFPDYVQLDFYEVG